MKSQDGGTRFHVHGSRGLESSVFVTSPKAKAAQNVPNTEAQDSPNEETVQHSPNAMASQVSTDKLIEVESALDSSSQTKSKSF